MSATNRGRERNEHDFYETPKWLTETLVPHLHEYFQDDSVQDFRILEPACGAGAISRIIADKFPWASVIGTDLQDDPPVDFLLAEPDPAYDLIITNPPYTVAWEFIQQALKWRKSERSIVAMLLRLNFLGSRKRAKWLRAYPPHTLITPRRPTFTADGKTDATEYAWFLWREPFKEFSGITMLDTEDMPSELQVKRAFAKKYKKRLKKLAPHLAPHREAYKVYLAEKYRKKLVIARCQSRLESLEILKALDRREAAGTKYRSRLKELMKQRKKEAVMGY